MKDNSFRHARLAAELRSSYDNPGPGYTVTYKMIASGIIPAEYRGRNIYIRRDDLPKIAEILGIATTTAPRAA